jgi:hypothetical protein
MAFEQKDMSGAIFPNTRKEKPNHPDYRGDMTISGRKYKISGWRKETKNGDPFLSLAIQEEDAAREGRSRAPSQHDGPRPSSRLFDTPAPRQSATPIDDLDCPF